MVGRRQLALTLGAMAMMVLLKLRPATGCRVEKWSGRVCSSDKEKQELGAKLVLSLKVQ